MKRQQLRLQRKAKRCAQVFGSHFTFSSTNMIGFAAVLSGGSHCCSDTLRQRQGLVPRHHNAILSDSYTSCKSHDQISRSTCADHKSGECFLLNARDLPRCSLAPNPSRNTLTTATRSRTEASTSNAVHRHHDPRIPLKSSRTHLIDDATTNTRKWRVPRSARRATLR